MFRDNLFIFLLLLVFVVFVECKPCESMDIRNSLTNLNKLRDCTEIVGNLKILLMEKVKSESDFDDYVFPNLTRITGYLFFYNVLYLTSIGKLFPNLRVIRGYELFTDFSIVIHTMPHLTEIGTTNLMYIARGHVMVDKCPKLCYADKIDWESINTTLIFTNTNNGTCEACPRNCSDYCWNMHSCQHRGHERCHEECLGCYKNNSASNCWACKNYDDHGTCVSDCVGNNTHEKYKHSYMYRCVTEKECKTSLNGTWWIFNKTCVNECPLKFEAVKVGNEMTCRYCGDNCTKWCKSDTIDSMNKLQKLKGCTHINGSLVIQMAGVNWRKDMSIADELSEYLSSVRFIRDSLVITWTRGIRSLSFLRNLKVINGTALKDKTHAILFRENQNLQKLWNFDDKKFHLKVVNGSLGFQYNPQLCTSEIRRLAKAIGFPTNFSHLDVYANGEKSGCNYIDLAIVVDASVKHANLSWETIALPDDDIYLGFTVYYIEHAHGNISTFESTDVCDGRGWKSQFTTTNETVLSNLLPYTRYAYYIKIYQKSMEGAQSNVSYFKTLAAEPEAISYFSVTPKDYHTLNLTWEPPRATNGFLTYYRLYAVMEPDRPVNMERDFCLHPRTDDSDKVDDESGGSTFKLQKLNKTTLMYNNCSCEIDRRPEEIGFLITDFYAPLCDIKAQSKFGFDTCKSFVYQREKRMALQPTVGHPTILNITANVTKYELSGLRHYSLYVFYLCACNKGDKCGPVEQVFSRTKKKVDADDIEFIKQPIVDGNNVIIEWAEPTDPNSMIVSYNVEYSNTDLEHSVPVRDCLARNKRSVSNMVTLPNMLPGRYISRVQAVSLAGPGRFSKYVTFVIDAPSRESRWIVPIVVITLLIVMGALVLYLWYKRKHRLDNIHLIATINPDYDGVMYVEDEWEIDRNDIELLNDLGHGTFGTVYCGLIKSRNMSCAVKTVNDNVSLHERMEFLNEASVMKAFSNSHHVVKLLGVVSKGQPPLVIMELMERGDLKKYLRRMRDSSQNITANEIYRMSIEIADGMAYLSAKKFVHRDLAARNCMVAHDRTVKIGDFGMARDIYETDYYRKETKGLLPVRWMAPESLADGIFSSDSDVWSYGIVLWEIATLAEQPYQGLSNEQVLQFVVSKGRLERPPECPDLLYEIMDACWCWRPNDRPTFADIVERLEDHVGQDFKLVSFIHSREGLEHKVTHGWERAYNPPALGMGAQEYDLYGGHYNVSDEEVSLYVGESSRPRFLPSSLSQRISSSDLY